MVPLVIIGGLLLAALAIGAGHILDDAALSIPRTEGVPVCDHEGQRCPGRSCQCVCMNCPGPAPRRTTR